jgi:hypothetical protein
MSSKHAFGCLIIVLFCVVLFPQMSHAADWTVSPFRAQLADAGTATSADETGEPASDTLSLGGPVKKNIGKAVMFSLIIPGTGELYAGSWLRALPWFAIEVAGWAMFAKYHAAGQSKTDDFEAYAGWRDTPNNFDVRAYMWAEYKVANSPTMHGGDSTYNGSFADWRLLLWDSDYESTRNRATYLPPPFTHDVMTDDRQQFFEMIGKYFLQFGWGWKDTHDNGAGVTQSNANDFWSANEPDWTHSSYTGGEDNPLSVNFDGRSDMFFHYRDMRGRANDLLNRGNLAMEVVLVNHVLSALDAAFAVRAANAHLKDQTPAGTPKLGHMHLQYDNKLVDGQLTRYLTLTVPLN